MKPYDMYFEDSGNSKWTNFGFLHPIIKPYYKEALVDITVTFPFLVVLSYCIDITPRSQEKAPTWLIRDLGSIFCEQT